MTVKERMIKECPICGKTIYKLETTKFDLGHALIIAHGIIVSLIDHLFEHVKKIEEELEIGIKRAKEK